ncbi:LLM class flavin-dependent oxidoreductase [Nonomuraea sp. NPDC050328]|uniref:LLM class flavin-dependent oxidoreductase n=1 Tax=Nonomuraea sp. NPDC050328 TaxID=3364361 RepID=UPI0037BDD9A3
MRLGVMFDRGLPPEELVPFARALDTMAGIEDLWVVEDLGWTGGLTSAATALAVTSRLRVAVGITPAPLRNPALLAMELGNLARLHPGRFVAGIGHGVREWMRQAGVAPRSPLSLLEETLVSVSALLSGEQVSLDGREVRLDGVRLVHPPQVPPPLMTGAIGPKSLALSGRLAQGTIVPEGYGPERVRAALEAIAPTGPHELVVLTYLCSGELPEPLAAEMAGFLQVPASEVASLSGTPDEAVARLRALWEAGADTVVLRPTGPEPLRLVVDLLGAL